jgi:hypothetical protein
MREELKALGLAEETVNAVMVLHGKKMTEAINKATADNADGKAAQEELKKYQKGGEYYVDKKEHERLKAFETETLTKAEREKKTAALTKLYKSANASDSAVKLLLKSHNLDEIELDDKGEVKGGVDVLKAAQADYADLFSANGNAGVPHATEGGAGTSDKNPRAKIY